jgi:iron complex outermembrane recepter protein
MDSNIARGTFKLMAGVALAGLAVVAQAQEPATGGQQSTAATGDEIIVTATRRNERLLETPVTVTAITNEQLENLNITQFADIQQITPGLISEERGNEGRVTSLRGLSGTVNTGSSAGVVVYINELPVEDFLAFKSLYDIGQIEVLRGPQGTLRGIPAPFGSITVSTRRPDLNEVGGTANVTLTDQVNFNAQAALNLPIINDRLALRVAALYDRNENGNVHNPLTGARSGANTKSARASLLFEPIDALTVLATYQYMQTETDTLTLVEGNGLGYNGPVIRSGRRGFAVQERPDRQTQKDHLASLNAKLDISDEAVLSYIGGYYNTKQLRKSDERDIDPGNAIPGFSGDGIFSVPGHLWSHELRLDSAGRDRFWDYTVGGYYSTQKFNTRIQFPGGVDFRSPGTTKNKSVFASSTFHLPTHTDVTVGARRLFRDSEANYFIAGFPFASVKQDLKAWVYDAKIVQHIGDDQIVYASYGHCVRLLWPRLPRAGQ